MSTSLFGWHDWTLLIGPPLIPNPSKSKCEISRNHWYVSKRHSFHCTSNILFKTSIIIIIIIIIVIIIVITEKTLPFWSPIFSSSSSSSSKKKHSRFGAPFSHHHPHHHHHHNTLMWQLCVFKTMGWSETYFFFPRCHHQECSKFKPMRISHLKFTWNKELLLLWLTPTACWPTRSGRLPHWQGQRTSHGARTRKSVEMIENHNIIWVEV